MNANQTIDSTEILHALRGLSHDMGASQIMLEHSFRRLKSLLEATRIDETPPEDIDLSLRQVEACMKASRGYLDDVLRLSTSGTAEMEPEPVDLAAIVDRVLLEQTPLLNEWGVRVQVRRPLPAVWCHPDRLRQILTNLLRNAVLHGCDPERPQITVHACSHPDRDDSMAAIRIHDNGPGIDRRRRREIFLPGRRLSDAQIDGSGWGLPTAKRIAERFGGSLALDTDCTTGTAFILALPGANDALDRSDNPEPFEDGRGWRIQLDARHHGPLRHGHAQLAIDECRMTSDE